MIASEYTKQLNEKVGCEQPLMQHRVLAELTYADISVFSPSIPESVRMDALGPANLTVKISQYTRMFRLQYDRYDTDVALDCGDGDSVFLTLVEGGMHRISNQYALAKGIAVLFASDRYAQRNEEGK